MGKNTFDGAGRETFTFTSNGGGDVAAGLAGTWTDAANVTGDVVLSQRQFVYDADGNVIERIAKERLPGDAVTATGALGDVSTGVQARAMTPSSSIPASWEPPSPAATAMTR